MDQLTLREWIDGRGDWFATFWGTITTTNPLDWPISYFVWVFIFGMALLIVGAFVLQFVLDEYDMWVKRGK